MKVVAGQGAINLKTNLPELVGQSVKIGWFNTARYPDGTNVAYVAVIQEMGAPEQNIPPRPFMGPAESKNKAEWIKLMEQGAEQIIDGKLAVRQVLDKVGMRVEGDVAKAIVAVQEPPLAQSTIDRRLAKRKDKTVTPTLTKPLVDTGLMLASLSHTIGKAARG